MPNYEAELARLYVLQLGQRDDAYLRAHSRNKAVLRRQIRIFERCAQYFHGAQRILDWGCRHAADACLVRMLLGPQAWIDACDVDPPVYDAFFDFAGLHYSCLTHPYQLPYESESFDAIIASGVIEHVPQESASLAELYRVLRTGGHLVVTHLPNSLSYVEFTQRLLNAAHHSRRYSMSNAKRMLLHHGFVPVRWGYHQVLPTLSSPRTGIWDTHVLNVLAEHASSLNALLERFWPINRFATNIFIVGRKVAVMP